MKETTETGLCPSLQSRNASGGGGYGDGDGTDHVLASPSMLCTKPHTSASDDTDTKQAPTASQHALRAESEWPGNPTDFRFGQFLETFYCLLLLSDK